MMPTRESDPKPRKTVVFAGHNPKEVTDDLLWDLMRAYRQGRVSNADDTPVTDTMERDEFERWKLRRGLFSFHFYFPKPHPLGRVRTKGNTEIVIATAFRRFELDNFQHASVPLYEKEAGHWYEVVAGRTRINYDDPYEMSWFLEKALLTVPFFEPDFAFADVRSSLAKNIGENPGGKAWPVLVYGPEKVKEFGREKLLEAPAFRVDELDYGGVLIQAAENPFVAKRSELKKLAEYLGLEMPG